MFDLSGKTALITGATGGIGKGIAMAFHDQGANLILSGTRQHALEALADELKARKPDGGNLYPIAANLSDVDSIAALAKQAEAANDGIDILVNNAGATRDNLALRMKQEEWDEVIALDLSAVFYLTRALLKGMVKQRAGRIINISSVVGVTGNPGQINYAAAKAGLIGMSKSLAMEVATRGITVNSIAPGFIATHMTDGLSDDQKQQLAARIPMGRIGNVDEIASACVYLASNEASYMTGQTLHINGGMAMI
ncbi:MAG: 3-oxoacyl-[acyl-carrier-protein] reductase [Alphaproteobacteria bacterium]